MGLTVADLFDAEAFKHFMDTDRDALSTSWPHIYQEDVPDGAGVMHHLQTT